MIYTSRLTLYQILNWASWTLNPFVCGLLIRLLFLVNSVLLRHLDIRHTCRHHHLDLEVILGIPLRKELLHLLFRHGGHLGLVRVLSSSGNVMLGWEQC